MQVIQSSRRPHCEPGSIGLGRDTKSNLYLLVRGVTMLYHRPPELYSIRVKYAGANPAK